MHSQEGQEGDMDVLFWSPQFHILLEDLRIAKTRNMRRIRNGREEMKLSLFLNDASFYVENPSESNGTLKKPLREFSEIAMFHIKNQLCFSTPIFFVFFFWLRWVFVAAHGLSVIATNGGYSSMRCTGFSLRWLLLLWITGTRCAGFSSCGSRAQ